MVHPEAQRMIDRLHGNKMVVEFEKVVERLIEELRYQGSLNRQAVERSSPSALLPFLLGVLAGVLIVGTFTLR